MRVLALLLVGCPDPEPEPSTNPAECDVTWDNFARGYVQTWCTPCHASTLGVDERQGAPPGVDFDRWSDVVAFADRVRARATGPQADMPPLGGTDPGDVALFEAWLDCGAPGADDPPGPCDELVSAGAVTVTSQADADALCAGANAADTLVVDGTVTIDCLCEVAGDVVASAGEVDLGALVSVGGDLRVTTGALALRAHGLGRVDGALSVDGAAVLAELGLDALEDVDALTVRGAPGLTALSLPRLRRVRGDLVLEDLPALVALDDTRAVVDVGGDLVLRDLDALGSLDTWAFQFLAAVGGSVVVEGNDALADVGGFTLLGTVTGDVVVAGNPRLTTIDGFDTLATVGGDLVIRDNALQENVFGLDNLRAVGGALVLEDLPRLRSFAGVAALGEVGELRLARLNVPDFAWLSTLEVVHGDLAIVQNPNLAAVSGLAGVGAVGGDVTVRDNPSLPAATIDAWLSGVTVGGQVTVEENG